MTAKQKAARAKFKAVVAEAKKLRKKNPKLTQAQAVKQAWAISYSKEGKSKVGALPIDFKGNFLGYRFKVLNQYQLDGGVTAQLVELDGKGDIITELSGNNKENDRAAAVLYSGAIASGKDIYLDEKDKKDLQKRIKAFVVGLNKEVQAYNSGKDTSKKKSKGLKIVYKPETKKLAVVDQIKSILKENKKILKGGYSLKNGKIREQKVAGLKQTKYLGAASSKVKARKSKSTEMHTDTKSHNVNIRVVSGMKRDDGYIGKAIIKKYTISEIKKLNPIYFNKGLDAAFGVYARKLMVSPKLNSQVMIEAHKNYFGGEVVRDYSVRQISSDGKIERPQIFNNLFAASNYVGKNIIL